MKKAGTIKNESCKEKSRKEIWDMGQIITIIGYAVVDLVAVAIKGSRK